MDTAARQWNLSTPKNKRSSDRQKTAGTSLLKCDSLGAVMRRTRAWREAHFVATILGLLSSDDDVKLGCPRSCSISFFPLPIPLTLEVIFNVMCSINLRFTYLLTLRLYILGLLGYHWGIPGIADTPSAVHARCPESMGGDYRGDGGRVPTKILLGGTQRQASPNNCYF